MKPVKISEGYLDELKEHGETPNKAIGNLLGNPKVTQEGNPKEDLGNLEQTESISQSVADLKEHIIKTIKSFSIVDKRLKDIEYKTETLKEEMTNEFNLRVNKVISHSLNSALEGLKRQILQELKIREVAERSKGQD